MARIPNNSNENNSSSEQVPPPSFAPNRSRSDGSHSSGFSRSSAARTSSARTSSARTTGARSSQQQHDRHENASQSVPPSFSPRESSSRGAGHNSARTSSSSRGTSQNPSRRTSQGSTRAINPHTASGTAASSAAPSYAPQSSRMNQSASGNPRSYAASTSASSAAQASRISGVAGGGRGGDSRGGDGHAFASQPRRRGRFGHYLAVTLISLLVIALGLGTWGWFWVDGQLNRTIDLTSAADNSSANTWLILGSDARDGQTVANGDAAEVTGFRTDTILVLTKPRSGPSSLISIPRDSYVEVNGQGMKINAVAQYAGYDALISSVEGITGTKIDHIAQIGFDGVANIVDALGGVELCYDNDVNDPYSSLNWTAGCHTADGTTALAFARMRYADPEGDIGRAKRQRQVISAIMHKAASASTLSNPAKALRVASATFKALSVDKNASTGTMISMALAFRDASGSNGISGSVYYDNLDYEPGGIGSAVHLDAEKNTQLFAQLNEGSIAAGTAVGGYTGQ